LNRLLVSVLLDDIILKIIMKSPWIHFRTPHDRILVIDNGKIIESGSHEELASHSSYYKKLLTKDFS